MYLTILGNLRLWTVISNESSIHTKSDRMNEQGTKRKSKDISCATVEI